MKQSLKKIVEGGLRLLLTPLRLCSKRKYPQESKNRRMELPNHILLAAVRDAISEGHTATISVKGWSMRPFLEHMRDKVLLADPTGATIGDAVLAEIEQGHFVLHRIINVMSSWDGNSTCDIITLMGDGNIQGTEECWRRNLCGKVTQYIYPHKTVSAANPCLRLRIRLWRWFLPIRRCLLAIYKATV